MSVSMELVKELREKTGAGMLDCKNTLEHSNGDIDKAIKVLREKGLASASKKSGRAAKEGLVSSYIHGDGRIGVLLEINCETDFVARNEKFQSFVKDIAMHVAAMNPSYVKADEIPEDVKTAEKEIYTKQVKDSGKPDNIIEKIVQGRMEKFAKEICLLDQPFVKEPKKTIEDYVKETISVIGENIVIRRFTRWQLGEEV